MAMTVQQHLDKIKAIQADLKEKAEKDAFLNKLTEQDIINHFGVRTLIKMVYDARGEEYILDRLKALNNH